MSSRWYFASTYGPEYHEYATHVAVRSNAALWAAIAAGRAALKAALPLAEVSSLNTFIGKVHILWFDSLPDWLEDLDTQETIDAHDWVPLPPDICDLIDEVKENDLSRMDVEELVVLSDHNWVYFSGRPRHLDYEVETPSLAEEMLYSDVENLAMAGRKDEIE